ncbi:hypothetical protein [Pseudomonas capsici]|uniref:hypothetical protein n=1 Tax=Pseudomonas capsici TaxID=2810614 RepID=UPI0021F2111B|nr:hypothetical protein [Pseudomonas capsici]MCV4282899.1 hypothetical protein [Pseudomonas capsici]
MTSKKTSDANQNTSGSGATTASRTVVSLQIPVGTQSPAEAVTQPHVREANGTAKLNAAVANRGFSLVLPGFSEEIYDELLMTFSTSDNSVGIVSTLIPFVSGKDSIDIVTPEEISGRFRAGDRAKIKCFLRVTHDIWVEGKDSIEYEIV